MSVPATPTFTYTGDPAHSPRDHVRFLIGDVDVNAEVSLNDDEIEFLLDQWSQDPYDAARNGCELLAARFTGKATVSKSVGDLSLSKNYASAAAQLREQSVVILKMQMRRTPPKPFIDRGNVVRAEDREERGMQGHEFYTGLHDNPGS